MNIRLIIPMFERNGKVVVEGNLELQKRVTQQELWPGVQECSHCQSFTQQGVNQEYKDLDLSHFLPLDTLKMHSCRPAPSGS